VIITADYDAGKMRILQLATGGDTLSDRSLAFSPVPVGRDERAAAARMTAAQLSRPLDEDAIRAALERLPQYHSPYSQMSFGDDGSVLLHIAGLVTDLLWLRVNDLGVVDGYMITRAGRRPLAHGNDGMWTVSYDSTDVPTLERFRLRRP
jgi:hypothetical protein